MDGLGLKKGKRAVVTGIDGRDRIRAAARLRWRRRARVVVNGPGRSRASTPPSGRSGRKCLARRSKAWPPGRVGRRRVLALARAFPEAVTPGNNMGIFRGPRPFGRDPTDADWMRFFEANVMSGVRLSRHYVTGMRALTGDASCSSPAKVRAAGPGRDDPLRRDQDGAAGGRARGLAEAALRHRRDGEQRAAVVRPHRRASATCAAPDRRAQRGADVATVERDFFKTARPSSIPEAPPRPPRRGRGHDRLPSAARRRPATTGAALRVDGGVVRSIAWIRESAGRPFARGALPSTVGHPWKPGP